MGELATRHIQTTAFPFEKKNRLTTGSLERVKETHGETVNYAW